MSEFNRRVIETLNRLKPGDIASYGEIAEEAGFPRAARAVGNLLASHDGLPWWRVVHSDGTLGATKPEEQIKRLRREGVEVKNGRVVPKKDGGSNP
jgi:methylated-DNA-protein-cysteine methyltransferase related protein